MTKREKLLQVKAAYDMRIARSRSRRRLAYFIRCIYFLVCGGMLVLAALSIHPILAQKMKLFIRRLRYFTLPLTELVGIIFDR